MKLKTRTNQPVYYKLPVSSNIQSLSDDLLNSLRVGDVVQKKTGNQKHCYIVSYKEEKHGICLTYTDCSCVETISYDYTDGHWVFNSKDVTPLGAGGTQLYKHTLSLTGRDDQLVSHTLNCIGYSTLLSSIGGDYANGNNFINIIKDFISVIKSDSFIPLTFQVSSYGELTVYYLSNTIKNELFIFLEETDKLVVTDEVTPL